MRRLRPADWLVGLAGVALAVTTFAAWFGPVSGWSTLGWAADVLVALALLGAAGTVVTIAGDRSPSAQILTVTGATIAAAVATIVVALEVLGAAGARLAAYGAVVAAALLTAACWRSMADERTDSATSVYAPPQRRPAPPR
jgi:hypothetical protein